MRFLPVSQGTNRLVCFIGAAVSTFQPTCSDVFTTIALPDIRAASTGEIRLWKG